MEMIRQLIKLRKEELDIFNLVRTFGNSKNMQISEARWITLKGILTLAMIYIFGSMEYFIASNIQDRSYMLIIFYIATFFVTLFIGIIRSQNILFNAKDNSLLLTLPISKYKIIISRVIVLLISQYSMALLIMVPAIFIYAVLENPIITYYVNTFISVLLLPIIPTIIGAFIGYIIQIVSSRSKRRNSLQIVLTILAVMLLVICLFNIEYITEKLNITGKTLEEFLTKLNYPLAVMYMGINGFVINEISITIILNILAVLIFIFLVNLGFFYIVRNLQVVSAKKTTRVIKGKKRKVWQTLIINDLKKYFASPIYILNTMLTPVIMFMIMIYCYHVGSEAISNFFRIDVQALKELMAVMIVPFIIMMSSSSSLTSCSVSLEGKKHWINRSIPVETNVILLNKVVVSVLVMVPLMLASTIIFTCTFDIDIIISLLIIISVPITCLFVSLLGLLVNLILPNMDFINENAAIKQSKSSFVTTILVIIFGFICNFIYSKIKYDYIVIVLVLTILVMLVLSCFIWKIIKDQGKYRYEHI